MDRCLIREQWKVVVNAGPESMPPRAVHTPSRAVGWGWLAAAARAPRRSGSWGRHTCTHTHTHTHILIEKVNTAAGK